MTVDHRNPAPLYQQLAEILREQIRSGQLRKDAVLPSESHLQQEHGLSRVTVRKAISVLRDEGSVYTIQARGTFVASRAALAPLTGARDRRLGLENLAEGSQLGVDEDGRSS